MLFLLCRAGTLRSRRGCGWGRRNIPAVPGFGGGRSLGTAGLLSCYIGLGARRTTTGQFGGWRCRCSCYTGTWDMTAAFHRRLIFPRNPAWFLLCRTGPLPPRRGHGWRRWDIPAVPGCGNGGALGTASAHSCRAGLRTWCADTRLTSSWRCSGSCCVGFGDFCFLRDFGGCTAKAGSPGRATGSSPERAATAGFVFLRTSAAETTVRIAEAAAKTAAARNTLSGEASTPGSTSETAAPGGILGETSATGSTPTSETTALLGVTGEAASPVPGKSTASAGGAACKAAALRSVEAGESYGSGRISLGSGFFCCLSVRRPDIAGSPMRTGLYGRFPAGPVWSKCAAGTPALTDGCSLLCCCLTLAIRLCLGLLCWVMCWLGDCGSCRLLVVCFRPPP